MIPGYSDVDLKRIHTEDDDKSALEKQLEENDSVKKDVE
jgi:hypothetical protein